MDNLVLILDVRFTCTNRETETNRSQVDINLGSSCFKPQIYSLSFAVNKTSNFKNDVNLYKNQAWCQAD